MWSGPRTLDQFWSELSYGLGSEMVSQWSFFLPVTHARRRTSARPALRSPLRGSLRAGRGVRATLVALLFPVSSLHRPCSV